MDVEVVRTFLEIVKTRSFIRAAEHLFVTQTTVSARIQVLEQQLDRRLFIRNRAGAELTPEGERFMRYATQLVQAWDHAKEEIALPEGQIDRLAIGCELSLWDPFMLSWLVWLGTARPQVAIRTEVELAEALNQKVDRGLIDIAMVYSPEYYPDLQIELLLEEKLVLVTTNLDNPTDNSRYVRVGWGADFLSKHDSAFPAMKHSSLFVGQGPLALQYILRAGGSGYFRSRAIEPYLESGKLTLIDDAPEFTYPVYSVHKVGANETVYGALAELRNVVAQLDE